MGSLAELACSRKCVLVMAVHAEHAHASMAAPANTQLLLFAYAACTIPQKQTIWLCSKATDKARWCVAFKSSPTVAACHPDRRSTVPGHHSSQKRLLGIAASSSACCSSERQRIGSWLLAIYDAFAYLCRRLYQPFPMAVRHPWQRRNALGRRVGLWARFLRQQYRCWASC